MRDPAILLLAFALAFLSLPLQAQEDSYDFELLVFEQPADGDTELFAQDPEQPPIPRDSVSLDVGNDRVQPLPLAEGQLSPSAYTLGRKGARVLAHYRWRQQLEAGKAAPWMRVSAPGLNGMIHIRRGRFLHLSTDLVFRQASGTYRVQERARMRSGELHYVDHPKIGILIRADRHQDAQVAPVSDPTPEVTPPRETVKPDDNPPEQRAPAGELPRAMPDPT